jgi:hypothetical protein
LVAAGVAVGLEDVACLEKDLREREYIVSTCKIGKRTSKQRTLRTYELRLLNQSLSSSSLFASSIISMLCLENVLDRLHSYPEKIHVKLLELRPGEHLREVIARVPHGYTAGRQFGHPTHTRRHRTRGGYGYTPTRKSCGVA